MSKKLSLRKQAQLAPKYMFFHKEFGFLSDKTSALGSSVIFTKDVNEAMKFSIGFDNPEMKKWAWNACLKKHLKDPKAEFEIVNE